MSEHPTELVATVAALQTQVAALADRLGASGDRPAPVRSWVEQGERYVEWEPIGKTGGVRVQASVDATGCPFVFVWDGGFGVGNGVVFGVPETRALIDQLQAALVTVAAMQDGVVPMATDPNPPGRCVFVCEQGGLGDV